jgi:membrane protein implicated in regulation of membrane protease activity
VYVLSLVFLLVSIVALVVGLLRGGLTLIFVSFGCSVLAALFLGASVLRRASKAPTEATAAEGGVEEWRGSPSSGWPG